MAAKRRKSATPKDLKERYMRAAVRVHLDPTATNKKSFANAAAAAAAKLSPAQLRKCATDAKAKAAAAKGGAPKKAAKRRRR